MLHRLNRTEYANAIRDLLDLEIDVATLLPPDDSARGFDNIAGSLTISPTLLEAYTTAAARIARMAVGFWKSPTEAAYIAPGDTSQNQHLEGLPFGTRGGMLVRHNFPADGEYKFSVQNFGLGSFIPGEKLEFLIDSERAHLFKYQGVGLSQGMSGEGDGSLDVTIPVKAGSHMVGVTFLATNYRPSLDMIRQYDRKSLENNSIPQLQYYPAIGILRIQGPFTAAAAEDSRSIRKVFTCQPVQRRRRKRPCAKTDPDDADAARLSASGHRPDMEALMGFYQEGRREGTFEDGIELALRRMLASPQFLVRAEREPANVAAGPAVSHHRSGTGVAPVVLPLEQHPGRRADRRGQPEQAEHMPRCWSSRCGACWPIPRSDALVENFGASVAVFAQSAGDLARRRVLSRLGRRAAPELPARDGAVLREHHQRRPQRRRSADCGLHVPQRAAGASITASRTSTGRSSAA